MLWLGLIIGMFAGTTFGAVIMAVMAAARDGDYDVSRDPPPNR